MEFPGHKFHTRIQMTAINLPVFKADITPISLEFFDRPQVPSVTLILTQILTQALTLTRTLHLVKLKPFLGQRGNALDFVKLLKNVPK